MTEELKDDGLVRAVFPCASQCGTVRVVAIGRAAEAYLKDADVGTKRAFFRGFLAGEDPTCMCGGKFDPFTDNIGI